MQELSEKTKTFLRKSVELYRDFSSGIDQHKAKVEFGKDWIVTQQLVVRRYILCYGSKFFPSFRALECLPAAERDEAQRCTDLALRAMKRAYEERPPAYGSQTLAEVLRSAKVMEAEITEREVKFGMLMAYSFSEFVLNCDIASEEDDAVRAVTVRDGILSYESLKDAWNRQMLEIEPPQQSAVARSEFSFVSNDKLKSITERDYSELQILRATGALKSRLILSGALIEGLLLDALEESSSVALASAKAPKGRAVEDWTLAEMIEVARDTGRITEGAGQLSGVARDFRNLVHPGKERGKRYVIGEAEVAGAEAALNTVIRDLRGRGKAAP